MKKIIRLTESDLHRIVKNAIRFSISESKKYNSYRKGNLLKENYYDDEYDEDDEEMRYNNTSFDKLESSDIINSMSPAFKEAFSDYEGYLPFGPNDIKFQLDKETMRDNGSIFSAKILLSPYNEIGEIWKNGYKGGYIGRIYKTIMDDNSIIKTCSFRGDTIEDLMTDMVDKIYYNIDEVDNAEEFEDDNRKYESIKRIINKAVRESINRIKK